MMDGEDLYHHLTTMSNLADELDKVRGMGITNEDFMTTVCFSIMGIPRYMNIVKIVMNGPALGRGNLNNKLTATEQRLMVTNERPLELHMAMQALNNRVKHPGKKKKGPCYNYGKEGHFAKECSLKPKRTPIEWGNRATRGGTEFIFTTQSSESTSNGSNTWILNSGAS
jgi:hypothetical protein